MTDAPPPQKYCSNCHQLLDPTDKFCRECGLPTLHRARAPVVQSAPPDTHELQRALDVEPDPRPFQRPGITAPTGITHESHHPNSTSSVVRATNPTFAAKLAGSTVMMIGLMVLLGCVGLVLLVLALRP